jgi:hypothetical protein
VTDSLSRNNLLYNNHASGISVYQIDGGSGSQNNRLLNNTIIMPADGRWGINIPDPDDTGNRIYNNIIFSYHSWRGSILIPEPDLGGFESDYNVLVNCLSVDSGNSTIGLAAWQALGYDRHSLIATPAELFVDPAAGDYRLKAGSPAIDAGVFRVDVPADLTGQPRPGGAGFDIGAYEFRPALALTGRAGDRTIYLTWTVNTTLPAIGVWRIDYTGPTGDQPSPITGIISPTRSYTLTGLTNYSLYPVTLRAMVGSSPVLTDTVTVMPTDRFIYLPVIVKGQ